MKSAHQRKVTAAEYAGRALGRLCRALVRLELQLQHWLVARGLAPGAAAAVTLAFKVAVCGSLLYAVLWPTVILALLIAAVWVVGHASTWTDDEAPPRWRDGYDGFGLYDRHGLRRDLGDRNH